MRFFVYAFGKKDLLVHTLRFEYVYRLVFLVRFYFPICIWNLDKQQLTKSADYDAVTARDGGVDMLQQLRIAYFWFGI